MKKLIFLSILAFSFTSIFAQSTQKERDLIQYHYSGFVSDFGGLDTLSIKAVYNSDNKLYVISSKILNSNKSFLLKVDETNDVTTYMKYLFETDLPKNLTASDSATTNGFMLIKSLDSDNYFTVYFKNGVRTFSEDEIITERAASPLIDCIKRVLRGMNFGQWCIVIATQPESMAGIILECAINVYIVH